jgi:hypothetical protein
MVDLCDFKKFEKLFMGKIAFDYCYFTWVKFHGKFFIKIATLQLIYYNYNYIC